MPRQTFLLQGLTARTHVEALKRLLSQTDLERVLLSVAFVTKGGVDLIASELAATGRRVDVFVGIRNGVTTREGLVALMDAGGQRALRRHGSEEPAVPPENLHLPLQSESRRDYRKREPDLRRLEQQH